jgi:hypothetical protein
MLLLAIVALTATARADGPMLVPRTMTQLEVPQHALPSEGIAWLGWSYASGGEAVLALPAEVGALHSASAMDEEMASGSMTLSAPMATEEICAYALAAYGATLDRVQAPCHASGALRMLQVAFLGKILHPLLVAAVLLGGHNAPGEDVDAAELVASAGRTLTLQEALEGVRLTPIVRTTGATMRATFRF